MNTYIFLTNEGSTYQPQSESVEPDCNNAQVIGISKGNNEEDAFKNLKRENEYLFDMSFNEVYCYKLDSDDIVKYFYLK